MKDEKETKSKLLACAKQEFIEKSYMKASLRNICKNAGVTTGALYFFFQDKEDLFAALVEEPLNTLYGIMMMHYQSEVQQAEQGVVEKMSDEDDIGAAKQVIAYIYQYYEEFQLVLTKAQGSRFENWIDRFVEITEKHYHILAEKMCEKYGIEKLDPSLIHWMSHMHIDIFVHMITHEKSVETAMKEIDSIVRYCLSGWYGMFQTFIDKKDCV